MVKTKFVQQMTQQSSLLLLVCVAYAVAMSIAAPGFAGLENLKNVWVAMIPLLIVAMGQTVVLISAGIDLSVTSTIAMASTAAAFLITRDGGALADSGWAASAAIGVALGVGLLVGSFNGAAVAWLRMPPFIVTLTSMMAVSGAAIWWTQSESIYNLPNSFLQFGRNPWIASAVALGIAAITQWLLISTLFGMRLRMVGFNQQTAHVSGVPVTRTIFQAYVVSGICAGVAAIVITGQLETGSPVHWENNLLDVIGATVLGGTSLYGGRGSVAGTVIGVLLLILIDNSLNLLNLSYFSIMTAKGATILLAALFDSLRRQSSRGDMD
jgi:ribose/xylose/arabinose/galactoside ABC-type transport system permease subunit